jgi:hypothetical protein
MYSEPSLSIRVVDLRPAARSKHKKVVSTETLNSILTRSGKRIGQALILHGAINTVEIMRGEIGFNNVRLARRSDRRNPQSTLEAAPLLTP